jgi:clan AA aspartic protease (TIGR02281 family)
MRRASPLIVVGLTILSSPALAPGAGGNPPEELLKEKDLRPSGTTYVLEMESEVQKQLNGARALYQQLSFSRRKQQEYTQGVAGDKALIQDLTQQRIMLHQQLQQAATVAQNHQLVAMIHEITDRLNLLREAAADPTAKRELDALVPRQREAFVQAVIGLRHLVDVTSERYKALAEDPQVEEALEALNRKTKAKLTLGPSRGYLSNVRLLEKVEASVLTATVELHKEGGVFWLDATFNGKVTKSMVFDTGAGITMLPAELADEIGLKPGPSASTVRCQTADGRVVRAKLMTVPTLRVGKFTVKDVECAVMPRGKEDIPPLLGVTFHKFFTYKFSPESGTLVLTKVDTPEEQEPRAAPRTRSSRASRSRRAARPDGPSTSGNNGDPAGPN